MAYRYAVCAVVGILSFFFGYRMKESKVAITCAPLPSREHVLPDLITSSSTNRSHCPHKVKAFPKYDCQKNYRDPFINKDKIGFIPTVISDLKHGNSPSKQELFFTYTSGWNKKTKVKSCSKVFITQTGSRKNQPNKCVAVVYVDANYSSSTQLSHRIGSTAAKVNQYMKDFLTHYSYVDEGRLMPPFLANYEQILAQFISEIGAGYDKERKTIVVMVLNEGVMDLFVNFMCSIQGLEPAFDARSIVVFLGQPQYVPVIENLGARAFYSQHLGEMPREAAGRHYSISSFSSILTVL